MHDLNLLIDGVTEPSSLVHCYCLDAAEADALVLHDVLLKLSTMQTIKAGPNCH